MANQVDQGTHELRHGDDSRLVALDRACLNPATEEHYPPSGTPLGPVIWHQAPTGAGLRTCREIDISGTVRTTLWAARHARGELS